MIRSPKTKLYWQQFRRTSTALDPHVALLRFGSLFIVSLIVVMLLDDQFLRDLFFFIACACAAMIAILLFRRKIIR